MADVEGDLASGVVEAFGTPYLTGHAGFFFALGLGDVGAPEVGNFSPANGTVIEEADPIYFDVTDDSGLFLRVVVAVDQEDRTELAHDGLVFRAPYLALSRRTNIAGGFRFALRRSGGWLSAVTVRVYPIDRAGNVA